MTQHSERESVKPARVLASRGDHSEPRARASPARARWMGATVARRSGSDKHDSAPRARSANMLALDLDVRLTWRPGARPHAEATRERLDRRGGPAPLCNFMK